MTKPFPRIPILCRLVALVLCGLPTPGIGQESGPPLVVQHDSAGVEIIEALRPLWGDSSLWSIAPDPLVDLALSGSGPSHEFFRARSMKQRPDGSAPNEVNRHAEPLILFDLDGMRIDSIGQTRGTEIYAYVREGRVAGGPPLFGKTSHIAVMGERIFRGSSDAMQVEELAMSGSLVRIVRIPGYSLDLSDAQVAAERDARLGPSRPGSTSVFRLLAEDLPAATTRPAYAEVLVDPSGAVWLELYRGESEQDRPQEWLILDADGTWLGTVEVPRRFTVMEVTMDAVLGVWQDELDVEHPQVLRLTRN